ncbi:hypothetical protein M422DRAFT_49328 [Sphaerobolus stellatus SS14]|uniref:Enoyl-CoA hydratase n=1 Tax=Sphaerobolus stellatus (strain SS14) TaxID=990650 RepID=A0A0C9VQM0_SPHS4|nr:hypothetical protein M422DRAFT_49328 [Sphaerobolus stellatus SS14]
MSTTKYENIRVDIDKHVALVTLSRPKAHNAWTHYMKEELIDAYSALEKEPSVHVIVITGDPAGKVFCAGADLSLGDFKDDSTNETQVRDGGGQFGLTVLRSRKITIAAINGSAAGIGITQTLPMDIRIAWADAKIVFPFVRRGIIPEATSTYLLPKLIGRSRALSIFLQGVPHPASSPLYTGLFTHILPKKEDVLPFTLKFAHELADNVSPMSVAFTKALVIGGGGSAHEQHLLDSRGMYVTGNGSDAREGVKAFLEKRPPSFAHYNTATLPDWLRGKDSAKL